MDDAIDDYWDGRLDLLEVTERLFGAECRDSAWARFGGRSIYIPIHPRPDHPLSEAIGHDRAKAVADELGGVIVQLPLCPSSGWRGRREVILSDALRGVAVAKTAQRLGCTERTVYLIRRSLKENGELPEKVQKQDGTDPALRRASILQRLREGISVSDIAAAVQLSDSRVQKIRRELIAAGELNEAEKTA